MFNFKSIHSNKTVALNATAILTDINTLKTYPVLEIVNEFTFMGNRPTEKDYNFIRTYFKYLVKQITDGCVFIKFDDLGISRSLPMSSFISDADFESGLATFISDTTKFAIGETIDRLYNISVIAIPTETQITTFAIVIEENK